MITYRLEQLENIPGVSVMKVSGHLDNDGANIFIEGLKQIIDQSEQTNIVIDCNEVSYITSMGLAKLIRLRSKVKKLGGNIKVARVKGVVSDVITTVGLDQIFHIYPTVEAAGRSYKGD